MSRERNFRVWDTKSKHMFYVGHEHRWDIRMYYSRDAYGVEQGEVSIGDGFMDIVVDQEHVMQSTGVRDDHGEMIYEQDVIEITYYSTKEPLSREVKKVVYDNNIGGYNIPTTLPDDVYMVELDIVGNPWENPEKMGVLK